MPWCTSVTPSCAARWCVAADIRADRKPTRMPARCASTIPVPSLMSYRLLSVPSACRSSAPSVRTPSTSNRISLMRAARSAISALSTYAPKHPRTYAPTHPRTHAPTHPSTLSTPTTLKQLRPPQIVQVEDAGDARGVRHDERRDLPLLHDVQRLDRQHRSRDADRVARHDVGGGQQQDVVGSLHVPPQVAVGDDADEVLRAIDDAGHAQLLARHLVDHVAHAGVGPHDGAVRARVHQRLDPHQTLAELAARMQAREIVLAESL